MLTIHTIFLQFYIESILKYLRKLLHLFQGKILPSFIKCMIYWTPPPSRKTDKPFMIFFQKRCINARLVVETFETTEGKEFTQIFVTCFVCDQQNHLPKMVDAAAVLFEGMLVVRWDKHRASDNRFDPFFFGFAKKIDRAKNVGIIGHRHRRHAELLCLADKIRNTDGAV